MSDQPFQKEVVFLGVASVTPDASTSKERYPIAVGVAFLNSENFQTILVKPPDSWGLIKLETGQERQEREKKKERKRVQVLAHLARASRRRRMH